MVGYGTAGAAAAIEAHDAGARVLVLEASPAGGGNALFSGGFLLDLPPDRAVDQLDALCFGRTPRDVLAAYADGIARIPEFLTGLGAGLTTVRAATRSAVPGVLAGVAVISLPVTTCATTTSPKAADGPARTSGRCWTRRSGRGGIEVRTSTPVERLLLDGTDVVGVVTAGGEAIRASRCRPRVRRVRGRSRAGRGLPAARADVPGGSSVERRPRGADAAGQVGAALWHMYGFFGWFSVFGAGLRRAVPDRLLRTWARVPRRGRPTVQRRGRPRGARPAPGP